MSLIAIVRIRGGIRVKNDVRETMEYMNIESVNHCVVYPDTLSLRGMLYKAKDYITWGEITDDTLKQLIEKRARLDGNKRITDDWLKSKKTTIDALVKKFVENPDNVYKLGVKKVFRLSPPSKGFGKKGIKEIFSKGGNLGDRKEKINDFLIRMI